MKQVLVIDDDCPVRTTICENLREWGFIVLEARNGRQGIETIDRLGFPDIVITDIIMPEMGGIEVIKEIRKRESGVKIIAISGGGRTEAEDFLETAKKTGADMAFSKPLDLDHLETAVNDLTR